MNNNYGLVSELDLMTQKFNNQRFETLESAKFTILYMQILEFAQKIGLINEAKKLEIADNILEKVKDETEGEILPICNTLYVIALWITSMNSNWKAWIEINQCYDKTYVKKFINKATMWFYDQISQMQSKLLEIKLIVNSFDIENIKATFNYFEVAVNNLKTFNLEGTELDLRTLHRDAIISNYLFLSEYNISKKENYLSKLDFMLDCFATEMGILKKLRIDEILKFIKSEQIEISKRDQKEFWKIDRSELNELDRKYKEEIQAAYDDQKEPNDKIDKLYEEFVSTHKNLSKEECEDEFDTYIDSLPEEFFKVKFDINQIDDNYNKKRAEMLYKIQLQENEVEKENHKNSELRGEIGLDISLSYILREYAIVSLARKGELVYPETPEERGMILAQITNKVAASEFLNNENLSEKEKCYLESI